MRKGTPEEIARKREEIINACEQLYRTVSFRDITLKEIGRGGREGVEAVLRRLLEASETTKRTLLQLPKYAVKINLEKLKARLAAELEAVQKKRS